MSFGVVLLRFVLLLILFGAMVSCKQVEELQSVSIVVTNGTVIDGSGAEPISDGLVAIQGNRIVAVGPSANFTIPDDAVIIDAAGGTILPGVFNAHAHGVAAVGNRRQFWLLDGVTSVCDLAIPLKVMPKFDQEKLPSGPAARGFKAGPILTVPGGYPGSYQGLAYNYEIQGADEAATAVHDLQARRADYIKVALESHFAGKTLPVLNLQELSSIVATAHANGLLVRAHITKSDMLDSALDAGVDVIEHVPMPSDSYETLATMLDDAGNYRIPSRLEAQMLRMIEEGVVLVPTLETTTGDSFLGIEVESESELFVQAVISVVRFFHDSGGIVALGNDYGVPGVSTGMPLREMELLQAAGLASLEVVEAATKHSAYVCGQGDELGALEKGKLADLIVVEGNPLVDLGAMDSVSFIVKDGEIVYSPEQDGD